MSHPNFNGKGLIKEFLGKKFLGNPFSHDDMESQMTSAPHHGEHSDMVYSELLNFSQEQIKTYRDGRII